MAKPQFFLKVIPEPKSDRRVVFHHDGALTGTEGSAPDFCCGQCGAVLVTGMNEVHFVDAVFRCHACGAFNDMNQL